MDPQTTIYILGSGAVGFPLAAHLAHAGRRVVAVRTSKQDVPQSTITITVRNGANQIDIPVETISLAQLATLDGIIVIAAKAYANPTLAQSLQEKTVTGPIVLLQNGVGVEKPLLASHFPAIYRGILYVTGQANAAYDFSFRPVTSSSIGIVKGDAATLQQCVAALTTAGFPFHAEANIQSEIWKKAILNAVFNSICPLLDVDNGVFARDAAVANLAQEIVHECVLLTDRLKLGLSEDALMAQIVRVSKGSDGQLISTLQDIRVGRPTEIEFLNLEIARVAAALEPPLELPKTELLGKMILAKSFALGSV
ncbi:MAG: 2-dehydropantoate 2-reductase [Caldilineaceae bacterium]